jgi:hypothetical protein
MLDAMQVTETLKQVQYTTRKRGKALVDRGVVEIRRGNTKSLWHELGHLVEYTEQNQQAAIGKAFVQSRATGKARKLSEINPKYRKIERYLPDDFVNPYIGKIYKTNTTEVFSMGIDSLADPKRLLNLAAKDPEHLALTLGVFQQDYAKASNVIPMGRQRQAAEAIGEDWDDDDFSYGDYLPVTEDQLEFRREWSRKMDEELGVRATPDERMEYIEKWIAHADKMNWDAEAIDIELGLA